MGAIHYAAGSNPRQAEHYGLSFEALNFAGPLLPPPAGWAPWSAADLWRTVEAEAEEIVTSFPEWAAAAPPRLARRQAALTAGSPLMRELSRRLCAAVVVGGVAFVHAHLDGRLFAPQWTAMGEPDRRAAADAALVGLNAAAVAALSGDGPLDAADAAGRLLDPVVWERMWAERPPSARAEYHLDALLRSLDASSLVIGHTIQDGGITPRYGGRVWCVDVGMSRGTGGGGPAALGFGGAPGGRGMEAPRVLHAGDIWARAEVGVAAGGGSRAAGG